LSREEGRHLEASQAPPPPASKAKTIPPKIHIEKISGLVRTTEFKLALAESRMKGLGVTPSLDFHGQELA
jgi:hypothetical protein